MFKQSFDWWRRVAAWLVVLLLIALSHFTTAPLLSQTLLGPSAKADCKGWPASCPLAIDDNVVPIGDSHGMGLKISHVTEGHVALLEMYA